MPAAKKMMANFSGVYLFCAIFLAINCHVKTDADFPAANDATVANQIQTPASNQIPPADSSKTRFSSVYTRLNPKSCQPISKTKNPEDEIPLICKGYKGYKIFLGEHGANPLMYIGREISSNLNAWNPAALPSFMQNNEGVEQLIEWRLADGEPFACIVRVRYDKQNINPDEKGLANELVIKNLKGFAAIDIVIDATRTPDANKVARRRADAAYGKI